MVGSERALAWESRVRSRTAQLVARWAAVGGVCTLLGVGLLICARRLAGALTAGLPPVLLVATVACVAAVVLGGRVVWRWSALNRARADAWEAPLLRWGGSAAILLFALGCSWGRAWDWLLWLPLLAVDQWQVWGFSGGERGIVGEAKTGIANPGFMEPIGDRELQRLVRVRDADGVEVIRGTLYAEFLAGQRQATLHAGFCPPLERLPVVEAKACNGPEAEVKVSQAFAHGARFEVRLARVAEEDCCVVVEVSAKPSATADIRQAAAGEIGRG
jgi:hypothetical protein